MIRAWVEAMGYRMLWATAATTVPQGRVRRQPPIEGSNLHPRPDGKMSWRRLHCSRSSISSETKGKRHGESKQLEKLACVGSFQVMFLAKRLLRRSSKRWASHQDLEVHSHAGALLLVLFSGVENSLVQKDGKVANNDSNNGMLMKGCPSGRTTSEQMPTRSGKWHPSCVCMRDPRTCGYALP